MLTQKRTLLRYSVRPLASAFFLAASLGVNNLACGEEILAAEAKPALSPAVDALKKAVVDDGKIIIDVRYRYEHVDQNAVPKDAHANTVRTRFGYETGLFHGFGVGFDFENIKALGPRDFNDTVHGKTRYPVVADPNETELNQFFLKWENVIPDTRLKFGRQRIIWDNHRFVGNVGWRQNEQTFDSLRLINASVPDTELEYVFMTKVHRIFGDVSEAGNHNMSSHLMHAAYKGFDLATITARILLLDYERTEQFGLSSQTYGLRIAGAYKLNENWKLLYTGEYAHQRDHVRNPQSFALNYWFGEGGLAYGSLGAFKDITMKGGYESLAGSGTTGFQTPLATLHLFAGWTDLFLTTPANGITDTYVSAGTKIFGAKLFASYHWYDAYRGGADYGNEFQLDALRKFFDNHIILRATYANYIAGDSGTGTQKLWLTVGFKY